MVKVLENHKELHLEQKSMRVMGKEDGIRVQSEGGSMHLRRTNTKTPSLITSSNAGSIFSLITSLTKKLTGGSIRATVAK